jgi:GNAT superfamily N-acetyltransferase
VPSDATIRIVPFRADLAPAFSRLNLEWIERLFRVEDPDRHALTDCERAIVAPGGQIFFALEGGAAIGTCAIIRHDADHYELAKMAVTPSAQGRGVGRRLAEAAVAFADQAGAVRVSLLTNSRLIPALRLYERLGFEHRPLPPDTEYSRADVYMELPLRRSKA